MKKLIILLVAGSFIVACDNKKEKTDTKTDTKTEEKTSTTENKTEGTTAPVPPADNSINDATTSAGWSKADDTRFMTDCVSTAEPNVGQPRANEYCNCMLGKIKELYSSYQQADRELGKNEQEMNRLAAECNGKQ